MTLSRLQWRLLPGRRAELAADLAHVIERLRELNRTTEHDFPDVGDKLGKVRDSVRQEVETVTSLSRSMADEQGASVAGVLDEVAHWADGTESTGSCGRSLGQLLETAHGVRRPLDDLRNSIRTLRVMGVVTRVESSRLGAQAAGFEALAEELDMLATQVETRAETILEAVDEVGVLLGDAHRRVERLERGQQAELRSLVAQSGEGMRELEEQRSRLAAITQNVEAGYSNVANDIRELFTALQFHDSTRQRIEHVEEGLGTLGEGLRGRIAAEAALPHLQLQSAQLREARREFLDSVGKVRTGLEEMSSLITGLASSARQLSGGNDAGGRSKAELPERCEALGGVLRKWIESRRDLLEATGKASVSCTRISGHTAEIEAVGVRMLWLALNSEVQAVRLDTSGAVMESVAECIRGISQQAAGSAAQVGEALRRMREGVAQLTEDLGDGGEAVVAQATNLAERVGGLAGRLRASGEERRGLLEAMAGGGESLAREIVALCEGLTADRQMDAVSGECLESLERATGLVEAVAGSRRSDATPVTDVHRYTMHAEREVHASVSGRPDLAAAPAPVANSDSEFGANVEMF